MPVHRATSASASPMSLPISRVRISAYSRPEASSRSAALARTLRRSGTGVSRQVRKAESALVIAASTSAPVAVAKVVTTSPVYGFVVW